MFIEHQLMPDIVLYTKDVRVNLEILRLSPLWSLWSNAGDNPIIIKLKVVCKLLCLHMYNYML